jgi:hypothetical protein
VLPCHWVTGGCEAYTVRKQAVRIELRNLVMLREPTPFNRWKAVSMRPLFARSPRVAGVRDRGMLSMGSPVNPGKSLYLFGSLGFGSAQSKIEPGLLGHEGISRKKQMDPRVEVTGHQGQPEVAATASGDCLRTHSTDEGGEPQGSRKGRPRYPLEGRRKQMDVSTW